MLIFRFIFWALNTKLRWQAQGQAKTYLKQQWGDATLTREDIRQRMRNDQTKTTFISSLERYIACMPGLLPFWRKHRGQLQAMISQVGAPHIFFTLSAADLHWPELHRLIEQQRAIRSGDPVLDINTLDEMAGYNRRIKNLTEFPHIVAAFLNARVELFLKLIKKIRMFTHMDHWYRFEWQFRGSGHVHGFLWLSNGPDIDSSQLNNPHHRQPILIEFFRKIIFGQAPIQGHPRPATHPFQCSVPVDKDNRSDVTELVNRCQRHKCTEDYCLRFNHRVHRKLCRFGFPQIISQIVSIEKNEKGQWTFLPQRGVSDVNINRYNPLWTAMWRGNTNISPVLDKDTAANYIGKYAAKAEEMSQELAQEIVRLTDSGDGGDDTGRLIVQLMHLYCIQRDFSAQEASHQILGLPMVDCSRVFETIYLSKDLTIIRLLNRNTGVQYNRRGPNAEDD
jgi:ATP-dependent DNA helicase PIF1